MIIDQINNNIFIIEKLNKIKQTLNNDPINLNRLEKQMKEVEDYSNSANYEYLNNMLEPMKNKGVKIPSKISIPTCSFQLHNYTMFNTNKIGNDVLAFNPFFLASEKLIGKRFIVFNGVRSFVTGAGMYFFVNTNDDNLTGNASNQDWYFPNSVIQMIPSVYSKYRLVSACCTLKYVGALEEAQGVMGGGISFLKSNYVGIRGRDVVSQTGGSGSRNWELGDYANFEMVRDCYYNTETTCLEGLKMLYFPLDNSFEEFKTVWDGTYEKIEERKIGELETFGVKISDEYFKSGFWWILYISGAPYSTNANFRFDFYLNFECLPDPEFLNYIPISLNVIDIHPELKKKFLEKVRSKAIQKFN